MSADIHLRKCINGKFTGCGKCVGYCSYQIHPGFLTRELRKEHDCIKKGCYYYQSKKTKTDTLAPYKVILVQYAKSNF